MRYRKLDANGDYSFGQGSQNFYVDVPAAVAQLVTTELLLHQGEWFLDLSYGMPWESEVLGRNTESSRDLAIKQTVLNVQGVSEINNYVSSLDAVARTFSVSMLLTTIYSLTPVPVVVVIPMGGYGVYPYGTEGFGE